MIGTTTDGGNSTDFSEDAAGGLIDVINYLNLMDCSDIKFSDDLADELIATAIYAGNSTDCAEDAAGGLIAAIDAGVSMNCPNLYI